MVKFNHSLNNLWLYFMKPKNCSCESGLNYNFCCGLYIDQQKNPPTAEALMRSRYTAYTQAKINYIQQTMAGPAAKDFDANAAREWATQAKWQGLKVINSQVNPKNPRQSFVEFKAFYMHQLKEHCIHEISEFQLIDKRWTYIDGKVGL